MAHFELNVPACLGHFEWIYQITRRHFELLEIPLVQHSKQTDLLRLVFPGQNGQPWWLHAEYCDPPQQRHSKVIYPALPQHFKCPLISYRHSTLFAQIKPKGQPASSLGARILGLWPQQLRCRLSCRAPRLRVPHLGLGGHISPLEIQAHSF